MMKNLATSLSFILAGSSGAIAGFWKYDAIVVGAGAGGCPLAQTLVEDGKRVLLVERGGEQSSVTETIFTVDQALRDECVESFSSGGVTVATGNCMGGATAINQGIFIQETPEWIIDQVSTMVENDPDDDVSGSIFANASNIVEAFDWVRERVAPEPTAEPPGSPSETYIQKLIETLDNRDSLNITNIEGQPEIPDEGIFRTHSIFKPITGERRSADTLLDRRATNLVIRTNQEVDKILFDGDEEVPPGVAFWTEYQEQLQVPRARCVLFTNSKVACLKKKGRIFLAAGVFHTPELLIKSGVGPGGDKVDNDEVGENLSDKPTMLLLTNFQQAFINRYLLTNPPILSLANIATVSSLEQEKTVILEETHTMGVPALLNLLAFERNFLPAPFRYTPFADDFIALADQCQLEFLALPPIKLIFGGNNVVSEECQGFLPLILTGCSDKAAILAGFVADPTSKGSVTIDSQVGTLNVNVNYLATTDDLSALGSVVRQAFETLVAIDGPAAPQTPCETSPDDPTTCAEDSPPTCPNLLKSFQDTLIDQLILATPGLTADMEAELEQLTMIPPSTVFPNFVEFDLPLDDEGLGSAMQDAIISPHHFAGTARFGSVIDTTFQVKGTEGLYVADASALPTTTRVNTMATTMAIGRLAAMSSLANWNSVPN